MKSKKVIVFSIVIICFLVLCIILKETHSNNLPIVTQEIDNTKLLRYNHTDADCINNINDCLYPLNTGQSPSLLIVKNEETNKNDIVVVSDGNGYRVDDTGGGMYYYKNISGTAYNNEMVFELTKVGPNPNTGCKDGNNNIIACSPDVGFSYYRDANNNDTFYYTNYFEKVYSTIVTSTDKFTSFNGKKYITHTGSKIDGDYDSISFPESYLREFKILRDSLTVNGTNTKFFAKGIVYKIYDLDNDGYKDAVWLEQTKENQYDVYNSDGSSPQKVSLKLKWVRNTTTCNENNCNYSFDIKYDENGDLLPPTDNTYAYLTSIKGKWIYQNLQNEDLNRMVGNFVMSDWDNDGDLDLIVGGYLNEYYYHENKVKDGEHYFDSANAKKVDLNLDQIRYNIIAYDWNNDQKDDLFISGDSEMIEYFEFDGMENGIPTFKTQKVLKLKNPEYISSYAMSRVTTGDLDNDGDLDMIVGNSEGSFVYYENLSGPNVADPKWTVPKEIVNFNNEKIIIKAGISGSLRGPHEAAWGYTNPFLADIDNDGDLDITFNNILGRIMWIENAGNANSPSWKNPKDVYVDWENVGDNIPDYLTWNPGWDIGRTNLITQHRSAVNVIDVTGDGDKDLIVMDKDGYLACYRRIGLTGGGNPKFSHNNTHIFYYNTTNIYNSIDDTLKNESITYNNNNYTPIRFIDYSKLVLGDEPLTNIASIGRFKFIFTDWDQDGDLDIIMSSHAGTTSSAMVFKCYKEHRRGFSASAAGIYPCTDDYRPYIFLENERIDQDGNYYFKSPVFLGDYLTSEDTSETMNGHQFGVTTTDFDGNGLPDLLTGTQSGYLYYYKNNNLISIAINNQVYELDGTNTTTSNGVTTINITYPAGAANNTVNIYATPKIKSATISGDVAQIDDQGTVSGNSEKTLAIGNNSYNINLITKDNRTKTYNLNIEYTEVLPTVTLTTELDQTAPFEKVNLTATATPGSYPIHGAGYRFRMKKAGEAWQTWSNWQNENTYSFDSLEPDTNYSFSAQVRDTNDNRSETVTNSIKTGQISNIIVSFNSNGGTEVANKTVIYNNPYGDLETPVKENHVFEGWYKENTFNNKVMPSTTVTSQINHTLYAKYDTIENIVNDNTTYNITSNIIKGFNQGTTVTNYQELGNNIISKIYRGKNEKENGYIATGDTLKIYQNNANIGNYIIVIPGDTNGDGNISVVDVSKLFQHYRGTKIISENDYYYIIAGDVVTDNTIKLTDVAKLFQYVRGKIGEL